MENLNNTAIVDETGAALVVYHGTDATFEEFDANFLGANTDDNASDENWAATAHLGFWFNVGGDLECAYGKKMACLLNIENPYHVDSLENLANYFELTGYTAEELKEKLMDDGFDGIVIDNDEEFGGTSFVAFNADQITIIK